MDKIRLGLVGCGGMGTRHLYGLRELVQSPFSNVELCAVCDIRRENAELAALEAEKLMDVCPEIFTDLEEMARAVPDLTAVDVVTDPSVHHDVVCQALDLGLHVMVEKPMAITVKACRQMIEAAGRNNRNLSVAENFRRDPSARLVRYLLETGAIGTPYLALFHALSPGNGIFITPWRHLKERGGAILDMAVHFTHMVRYQLGNIAEVYGDARLIEPVRRKPDSIGDTYTFYQNRHRAMEAEVPATAEDTSLAMFKMENGATVNWLVGLSGHGSSGGELIFGNEGSITGFGTRGGRISMQQRGREAMSQEEYSHVCRWLLPRTVWQNISSRRAFLPEIPRWIGNLLRSNITNWQIQFSMDEKLRSMGSVDLKMWQPSTRYLNPPELGGRCE